MGCVLKSADLTRVTKEQMQARAEDTAANVFISYMLQRVQLRIKRKTVSTRSVDVQVACRACRCVGRQGDFINIRHVRHTYESLLYTKLTKWWNRSSICF
jgi:hypothetical protein